MKTFKEHNQQDEALVAGDRNIVRAILNKLEDIMVNSLENYFLLAPLYRVS